MLRRQGPDGSKVGVFFCQEHGNEIATSGVCLETAERLVQLRDRCPDHGARRQPRHLHHPADQRRRRDHSLYDSNRRKNCPTTARTRRSSRQQHGPGPAHSWGVDMNRNFQIGSVFDGFRALRARIERQLLRPVRAPEPEVQRDLGADNVPQHQVRQQHPSNGGLFMWPPGLHRGARSAALPAVRHAELLRPDRQERPGRDQVAPRHHDRPDADRSRDRRALLGRGQLRGRGVLRQRDHRFRLRDRDHHYKDPATGVVTSCGAGQPAFGATTNPCTSNEGFHESMEHASGNFGMLDGDGVRGRTTPPVVQATGSSGERDAERQVHLQQASSIYYARRLNLDHGLHRVEAAARLRTAVAHLDHRRRHAEVDRHRLQGQRLGRRLEVL